MAGHPALDAGNDGKAAVGQVLPRLGGEKAGGAGGELCNALRSLDGKAVAEYAQLAIVLLEQVKSFPCHFCRHQAVQQAGGFAGVALGSVGIAAVHSTHGVIAKVPHGGTVGGDGIPDAGQLCHNRRQTGQWAACGGHHHHAMLYSAGNGLTGGKGDLVVPVQQGAVQIQRGKADKGKALQHNGSFYNRYAQKQSASLQHSFYFIAPERFAQDGVMWYNHILSH